MTQALPVQVASVAAPATASPTANSAESADSDASFADALAGQLGAGDAATPAQNGSPGSTATAPADSQAPDSGQAAAAMLAATGGKVLPPPVPTVAAVAVADATAGTGSESVLPQELLTPAASTGPTASRPAEKTAGDTTTESRTDDAADAALAALAGMLAAPAPATPVAAGAAPVADARRPATPAASLPAGITVATNTAADLEHNLVDAAALPVTTKAVDAAVTTEAFKGALSNAGMHAAADNAPAAPPIAAFQTLSATAGMNGATLTPSVATTGQIDIPVGHNAWGQAFSNQVAWAVNHGSSSAELHLSPPELGPVSVRLSLDHDQATIAFTSPHAVVRDAIEAAMPRLRDMLGAQGITLADVNVSQHQSQAQREPGGGWAPAWSSSTGSGEAGSDHSLPVHQARVGMLDVFV